MRRHQLEACSFPRSGSVPHAGAARADAGDLCGLVTPATPSDRRFFLLLVDDATCFIWVSLLTTKSAIVDAIKRVQAEAEKTCGRKL